MGRPLRESFVRWGGFDAVGLLCRLALAAVWLSSGLIKAADPRAAQVAVRAYQIFPSSVSDLIGATLPYLEIGLGLLLLLGVATRWVAAMSAAVLVLFVAGVASAALRGLSIDCGCFGGGGQVAPGDTGYAAEVLRDIGFLALAVFLILRPRTPWSVDRLAAGLAVPAADHADHYLDDADLGDHIPDDDVDSGTDDGADHMADHNGRSRSRLDDGSTQNRRSS